MSAPRNGVIVVALVLQRVQLAPGTDLVGAEAGLYEDQSVVDILVDDAGKIARVCSEIAVGPI